MPERHRLIERPNGTTYYVCAFGHEHEVESIALQHNQEADALAESVPTY